jgi:hypothetical protein
VFEKKSVWEFRDFYFGREEEEDGTGFFMGLTGS